MTHSVLLFAIPLLVQVVLSANLRATQSVKEELPLHPDENIGAKLLEQIYASTAHGLKMSSLSHGKAVPIGSANRSNGFWMSQSRSNADCSGFVTAESGTRTGVCHQDSSSGSHFIACEDSDATKTTQTMAHFFSTPDCTGPEVSNSVMTEINSCRFIPQFVPYYGFSMEYTSCRNDLTPFTKAAPGVMFSYHTEAKCNVDSVEYFTQIPFDSCRMFAVDDDLSGSIDSVTSYGYVKYTACSADGSLNMRFYADPQCSIATHRGTVALGSSNRSFNECQWDGSAGPHGLWSTAKCQTV
jgi:hypothetical protein